MDSSQLRHGLAQYTGCDQPFRHSLVRSVLYTDGVQFFAQNAGNGAYWFIDILATEPAIRKLGADFALITLTVTDSAAKIVVTDGNDDTPPVFTQTIEWTDCPEGEWKFYFEGGMIMLPQER